MKLPIARGPSQTEYMSMTAMGPRRKTKTSTIPIVFRSALGRPFDSLVLTTAEVPTLGARAVVLAGIVAAKRAARALMRVLLKHI
jgi:hypothetical protein